MTLLNTSQTPGMPGASAAQRTIAVVGDAWTLRILRAVFRGQRRYRDFVQGFGVSRAVLTDRLTKLVAHEVLLRDAAGGGGPLGLILLDDFVVND